MHFTPEHEALRDTVAKFVANEINPHVDEWEAAGEFPSHAVFKKMGDLGLLGLRWPEKYGGAGLDMSYSLVLAEELGLSGGGVTVLSAVEPTYYTEAVAQRTEQIAQSIEFTAPASASPAKRSAPRPCRPSCRRASQCF